MQTVLTIIENWLPKVRAQIEPAKALSDPFVIDHLDNFLQIVLSLCRDSGNPKFQAQMKENAILHGKQRAALPGYSVETICQEFSLLREETLRLITISNPEISASELGQLFDQALAYSTLEFYVSVSSFKEKRSESDQKAPADSERRLQEIFSHASVGFVVSTAQGAIIDVNPRFSEITGYERKELIGSYVQNLVHIGDKARETDELLKLVSGQVQSFVIEKRFVRKDHQIVWVRNSVSLIPGKNSEHLIIRVAEDITVSKEVERMRAESEARFLSLANSMPQIVWTATSQGMLDYFNQVWFDYSGSDFKDSAESGWTKYVHSDDLVRTAKNWQYSLLNKKPYENEFRLRAKDGSYRWFVARATPSFNPAGELQTWYGTNTDVHDFKVLTHELEHAEAHAAVEKRKFETIFADAGTSMAVLKGPDFVYEIANPSYLALFNGRDILGKPFVEALPELENQAFTALAKSVFESGVPYRDPEALALLKRTDEGPVEERYFDQSYTRLLSDNGEPYGVFIHAHEITDKVKALQELKVTSERFKNAVNAADMGTWEVNPQTNVVTWSERTSELFGVEMTDQVLLEKAIERMHPEDRERVSAAIKEAMNPHGSGEYKIEYRVIRKDGDTRWLSLLGKSFFKETAETKTTALFAGTVLDVTERVMAEVALRDAKDRAEAANAAKSAFLANMSHEIRTPLGAIMGFVSLIKDEHTTQLMLAEYVSVIERNSTQLMRIIDDILDLSKVEAGMMLIEHIDFSLVELLSDFSSLLGFRAREKGIIFEMKVISELPSMINSDPTRIRQILTNIVGNAIKFTEVGSVILTVAYSDSLITFEVSDTGRGLSELQASRLFQPFSQADASTTRKFGGTGLGLVLTRKLSEAMGGSFNLTSSEPNVGSVFTATVSVSVKPDTQMVKALGFVSQGIKDAGIPSQLRNRKVLLVEDSLDNQALFSIFLSRAGAEIDIASDGATGFDMAMAEDYDVVLMDVQMPIMDGITAVKKLRAHGYQGPVIALTAHAMKEERIRCLQAGYTDFLSKPIQRTDLIDTLVKYAKKT